MHKKFGFKSYLINSTSRKLDEFLNQFISKHTERLDMTFCRIAKKIRDILGPLIRLRTVAKPRVCYKIEKSLLVPTQKIEFLGTVININKLELSLPEEKINKIIKTCFFFFLLPVGV